MNGLIQWNCQGIRSKKDELLNIIDIHKPATLAIQETKLWNNNDFKVPNYTILRKDGHFNVTPHGGVALLIHETIPFNQIELNTAYQAVAARIQLKETITVCSLYLSRNHELSVNSLNEILRQLPPPIVLMGDFNSHNVMWGCARVEPRGRVVEEFINTNGLNLLNDGTVTRIGYNSESAIDLTIVSPRLDPVLLWSVAPTPLDSDHCPISIVFLSDRPEENVLPRLNIKRANWGLYAKNPTWQNIPEPNIDDPHESLLDSLYHKFDDAAHQAIPTTKHSKFYPKPYWTAELTVSRLNREKLYQKYRKRKSLHNAIGWKRARAEFRNLLKKTRRQGWIKLASTFTHRTPMSEIYENVRKIQGRNKRKINFLFEHRSYFTTVPEIANLLAKSFSEISSANNYCNKFKFIKTNDEEYPIDFSSKNKECYNSLFSIHELEMALRKSKNSAPGPDRIFYQMIKMLPDNAKEHVLKIINIFWKNTYYPQRWKEAIVIAFPKPGKDHTNPKNYRPIALTSSLGKTVERMVNNRLCDYLDMNGILSNIQCGCRKNRSTIDHLVRLESSIRRAFAHNEHFISIFFDLQKAYDTTWKFGILKDLYDMGLRGRLPQYIREFLTNRFFKVQINNHCSPRYIQEEGVPQGCVLSVTLFAIKINQMSRHVPNDPRFHTSLYVDDFQLAYRHSDLNIIQKKLQECLDLVSQWTMENGFTFSVQKTKAMHFTTIPGMHLSPAIKLYEQPVDYEQTFKFLGLTWDPKLTWKTHIMDLKTKCQKPLNFLRSISCHEWGADQKTLLHLYNILVRSRLDYGSVVYNSACTTTKALLDPIENEGLRIATGAFKSTPICNLQIITNQMPLELRRLQLSVKYYYKMRSHIYNPAFHATIPPTDRLLFHNKNLPLPLAIRVNDFIDDANIPRKSICPAFSYRILNIKVPTWQIKTINFNDSLLSFPKSFTRPEVYRSCFDRLLRTTYAEYYRLYTDGSKTDEGVGAAVVGDGIIRRATLPSEASIFTAELHAIYMASCIVEKADCTHFAIFSDSRGVLQSLQDKNTKNPSSRKLQHRLHDLSANKTIELCWIPGHAGIAGNERADEFAKLAVSGRIENIFINYRDMFPIINTKVYEIWNRDWNTRRGELRNIKESPGTWPSHNVTRREEVVLSRLRSQHTWLTHNYLMNPGVREPPPPCPLCYETVLTVKHLLLHCTDVSNIRRTSFGAFRSNPNPTLKDLLGDEACVDELMTFMRNINAYNLI
jgi:ribonuclease HI